VDENRVRYVVCLEEEHKQQQQQQQNKTKTGWQCPNTNELYRAGEGFTRHHVTQRRCNNGMTHTGAHTLVRNDTMTQ